jgi:hypothetical protein
MTVQSETAVVLRSVEVLIPHPQRGLFPDLDATALEQLIADIAVRGIVQPLIVTDKDTILSGHQRHRAAQALGLTDVPVIVMAGLSEADQLKYLIQENLRRRHLTPSQRAALVTSSVLAEVVATIAKDAENRRAQGGTTAGRGQARHLEATSPQAKRRRRAPQTRDIVADVVGVRGRLVSDARFCWDHAAAQMGAILKAETTDTVSKLARQIRREQQLAKVRPLDSDIANLLPFPVIAESGEYAAKFLGLVPSAKGFVVTWLVRNDRGGGFVVLLQRLRDERHPETGRLGRQTALGKVVSDIAGSSIAVVDLHPFVGTIYRLSIVVKNGTARVVTIKPQETSLTPVGDTGVAIPAARHESPDVDQGEIRDKSVAHPRRKGRKAPSRGLLAPAPACCKQPVAPESTVQAKAKMDRHTKKQKQIRV